MSWIETYPATKILLAPASSVDTVGQGCTFWRWARIQAIDQGSAEAHQASNNNRIPGYRSAVNQRRSVVPYVILALRLPVLMDADCGSSLSSGGVYN